MPQGKPMPGELYRHFKNKLYQIMAVATHSETRDAMVVYQALYGDFRIYVRPYEMFISEVDHVKYPSVSQRYRFELVGTVNVTEPEPEGKAGFGAQENRCPEQPPEEKAESVDPRLLAFLDTDDFEEKYKILCGMEENITNRLIDQFAVTLDVVIPDGSVEDRFAQLKICVRTRSRYETGRLR